MKRLVNGLLAHPAWTGIGGLAAIVGIIVSIAIASPGERETSPTEVKLVSPRERIPLCSTFRGTAPTVDDKDIWFVFRLLSASNDQEYFYLQAHRDEEPDHWSATTELGHGTGDETFEVHIVQIDRSWSSWIAKINAKGSNGLPGYYTNPQAPPGTDLSQPVATVSTKKDSKRCS